MEAVTWSDLAVTQGHVSLLAMLTMMYLWDTTPGVHQESPVDYRGSALSPGSLEKLVNAAIIFFTAA